MSNLGRTFAPWEDNFTKGLYLAGAECKNDAEAPKGWTKWVIPSYEYLYVESNGLDTFPKMNELTLVTQQMNLPQECKSLAEDRSSRSSLYSPIKHIDKQRGQGSIKQHRGYSSNHSLTWMAGCT